MTSIPAKSPLAVLGHALEVLHREIAVAPATENEERAALADVVRLVEAARYITAAASMDGVHSALPLLHDALARFPKAEVAA